MKKSLKLFAAGILAAAVLGGGAAYYSSVNSANLVEPVAIVSAKSNAKDVKLIQTKLKRWGYYSGAVDGIYGSGTKAAVKKFQKKNGLTADGIVGDKTLAAMGITSSMLSGGSSSASASKNYTSSDTQLLARLIYAEARGESYTGQVAVGAVVLNRVKSASFPNTISGVIYQPYAFTCVSDGQINYSPDATAIKAAKDALNGWDPTYGCLYYYNPKIATSGWIFSRKTMVTIGSHVFAL